MNIIQKLALGFFGSYTGARISANIIEANMQNCDTVVEPPIDTVSIHLPVFNEEMFIEQTLKSITNQSITNLYPDMFEYLIIDSGSKDRTVEITKNVLDILDKRIKTKIIQTDKRGKLTARNLAITQSSNNIIVNVDGDSIYPYHFLNTILKPFKDPEVIAVTGSTIDYSIESIPGWIHTLSLYTRQILFNPNRLYGRHCAFYRHNFLKLGQFDETVNQLDMRTMVYKEEIEFGNKMARLGKVVWQKNASCQHLGGLKIQCRNDPKNDICLDYGIGIERFGK